MMEDIFDGKDLEDLSGNDENLIGGIRMLETMATGVGDEMSFEEVELAAAAFHKLAKLLKASRDELQEQLKVNRLTGKDNSNPGY